MSSIGIASKCWAGLPTIEQSAVILLEGYQDLDSSRAACETIQASVFEWNFHTQPAARCLSVKMGEAKALLQIIPVQYNPGFIIHLKKSINVEQFGPSILDLRILAPKDSSEPDHLSWEINDNQEMPSVQKLLKKYSDFDGSKRDIKKALLFHGISESQNIGVNSSAQVIEKSSGRGLTFEEAYELFLSENTRQKNYLAAGLQIAATLGVWTSLYYAVPADSNVNSEDWDFNSKTSWRARFVTGEALRFDDNAFNTNRNHYYAGVGYYLIARESGLSRLESLLVTAATSSFWEYISEYREVVSINDQINTTLGGFIIGEAAHQIFKIFQAGGNSPLNRVLKSVFQSPRRFSNWLEYKAGGRNAAAFADFDSKPDIWGKLDFYAGSLQRGHGSQKSKTFGFDGQVYNIPMFEEPGRVRTLLMDDTVYSRLSAESTSGLNLESFKFYAKTTLAAIYDKNLSKVSKGRLEGYNLIVGPSMGLEINQETSDNAVASGLDQQGLVHVMGGTVDLIIYSKGVRFRCVLDIYGDFAMMRSYAYETYAAQVGTAGIQSVLQKRGYYYGFGNTQSVSAIANYQSWELGAKFQTSAASMIDQKTRFYENEDPTLSASDRITNAKVWVAYQLTSSLRLEAGLEKIIREGRMQNTNAGSTDLRRYGRLFYTYK